MKLLVDTVHGDIHLSDREVRVVDTASFQRTRQLKQLGMGQVTYPNATHTRFAHSIGALGVMEKIAHVAKESLQHLTDEEVEDLRLAGLLHDIGHYPYSHLMEKLDKVKLTEEIIDGDTYDAVRSKYPKHEELGSLIVVEQRDIVDAIGGPDRARRIASLFAGGAEETQLSKLIHSSMDIDRLDYLPRDSHATGVPYGRVDLNYLLNNFRISPTGILGIQEKALAAAEQALLARFFMYRTVYYHKTTFGMEEACRQLLRRVRDRGLFGITEDGDAVRELVKSKRLGEFTDAYVDRIVFEASEHEDPILAALGRSVRYLRPPRLVRQVPVLERGEHHAGTAFHQRCRHELGELAKRFGIPRELFLVCHTPPLMLEQRGGLLTERQARDLEAGEKEELIKVFREGSAEPESIVNIRHSIIALCSNHIFQDYRLYVVDDGKLDDDTWKRLCEAVRDWDQPQG